MNALQTLIDRYTAAATNLDGDALVSLYAPEVRLFDLMTPWQIHGAETWREGIKHWFQSVGSNPRVEASDVEIRQAEGMALLTMTMTYSHVQNGERFSMPNRLTWVVIPHGEDWQIIHEHTSVPLDGGDMKPVFTPE